MAAPAYLSVTRTAEKYVFPPFAFIGLFMLLYVECYRANAIATIKAKYHGLNNLTPLLTKSEVETGRVESEVGRL